MKHTILITIFIISITFKFLSAQAPDTLWTKTFDGAGYSDWGHCVQQTIDGGYIIVGNGVFLVKTDTNGEEIWRKTIGGNFNDNGYSVQQTTDGGFVIAGATGSFGAGSNDAYLIKTDSSGDTLWTRTFGGIEPDFGRCVQQTNDEGYIITGAKATQEGHGKIWLIKTDAFGDTIWTKIYGDNGLGRSVRQTSDGGYILTGVTNVFGLGVGDIFLIKTDSTGDTLWIKTYYEGLGEYDTGNCVQQTSDSGYIIVGTYLIKTDAFGNEQWSKSISGYCIQQTTDEGYIITGEEDNNLIIIKTNSSGDTLWTKTLGGSNWDAGESVYQTTDGGYIIVGTTSSFADTLGDIWLIKMEPESPSLYEDYKELKPSTIRIRQNYPNPFNPSTTIEFSLPKAEFVILKIYNLLGQEVATLVSEKLNAGKYQYTWDAGSLASGVYLYRLKSGNYTETKKMVVVR